MKTKILMSTSYILAVSVFLSLLFTIHTSLAQRASYATLETKELAMAYFSNNKSIKKAESVVINIESENVVEAWLFDPKTWEIEESSDEFLLEDWLFDEESWVIEPEYDTPLETWLFDEETWTIESEDGTPLEDWLFDPKSWEIEKKEH